MSALSDLLPTLPGSNSSGPVIVNTLSEIQSATQGQTVFDLAQVSYRPGYDDLVLHINGVTQAMNSSVYIENSSQRVTLKAPLNQQDQVYFSVIRAEEGNASFHYYSEKQLANQNQTEFELLSIKYRLGYQDLTVIINGITQTRSANNYTETSTGTRIILASGLNAGDEINFVILRMVL